MHFISIFAQADTVSASVNGATQFAQQFGILALFEVIILVVFGAWVIYTARNQKPLMDNLTAMARTNNDALRANNEINERLIEVVNANTDEKKRTTEVLDGVISELRIVRTDVTALSTRTTNTQGEIMPLVNEMRSDVKVLRSFVDGIEHKWEERLRAIVAEAVAKKRDTQPLPTITPSTPPDDKTVDEAA